MKLLPTYKPKPSCYAHHYKFGYNTLSYVLVKGKYALKKSLTAEFKLNNYIAEGRMIRHKLDANFTKLD